MKKHIYFTILLITFLSVNDILGQNFPKAGSNYPNPELDKFVGNWIWINKSDTVWLKTKKENLKFSGNFTVDALIGHFKQLKGKTVVRDSFKTHNEKKQVRSTGFSAGMNQSGNKIGGSLSDYEANKFYKIELILGEDQKSLTFSILTPLEGARIGTSTNSSIPKKMIFIKVK
ncbi:MAG: DUF6705 family protein [Bacteroidota bacterium]